MNVTDRPHGTAALLAGLVTALLAGCAVGPNYHRPSAPVPERFKEAEGWKPAEPREAASGTDWWSVYDDATLNGLEKQIDVSNQTLKQSGRPGVSRWPW
jgi:outer membrane protein TolC